MTFNQFKSTIAPFVTITITFIGVALLFIAPLSFANSAVDKSANSDKTSAVKTAKSVVTSARSQTSPSTSKTNSNSSPKLHQGIKVASSKSSFKAKQAKGSSNVNTNKSHHDVWFHSVDVELLEDPNHNGYYNRIIVNFDADTYYSSSNIYAELSLTDSYGNTSVYFTTDDFYIYGDSSTDDYQIDTVLTTNWIADGYELSIALYNDYTHELEAYIDASETSALADLHLESIDYEYQASHYLNVFSSQSYLVTDSDGDGYYHSFSLDLDIDNNYGSSDVYANVYISNDSYNWDLMYVSPNFTVSEDDTSDKVHWEFDLQTGYPPGHYYVRVEVIDLNSQLTLLTMNPDNYGALYALPLEDYSYEAQQQPVTPPPPAPPQGSVSVESGGSFGSLSLMVFSLLGFMRRRKVPVNS